MTTTGFSATRRELNQVGEAATKVGSRLGGTILPALGLASAFNLLGGSAAGVTGGLGGLSTGSLQVASQMSRLERQSIRIREQFAKVGLEVLTELTPLITGAADAFLKLNDALGGGLAKFTVYAATAGILYGFLKKLQVLRFGRVLGRLLGRGLGAAGNAATGAVASRGAAAIRGAGFRAGLSLPDIGEFGEEVERIRAGRGRSFAEQARADSLFAREGVRSPGARFFDWVRGGGDRQQQPVNINVNSQLGSGRAETRDAIIDAVRQAANQGLLDDALAGR